MQQTALDVPGLVATTSDNVGVRRPGQRWVIALVLVGSICRLAQYLSRQSFWQDEAYVVFNVEQKAPAQLLGALRASVAGHPVPPQSAPPLYLLALKGLDGAFGANELAYRGIAQLAAIVGLVLFARLAWRLLPPPVAVVTVGLMAVSDRLIGHADLVKQYSGDVCMAVALLLLATGDAPPARRLLRCALFTAAAVWFSEPLVFVFGGVSMALFAGCARERRGTARYLVANAIAIASFAVLYAVSMRHQTDPELLAYWGDRFPDYSRPPTLVPWAVRQFYDLLNYPYRPFGFLVLILSVLGAARLLRTGRRELLGMLAFPVLLTFLAACLRRYPFGGTRVTLFLIPSLLLLTGFGLAELESVLRRRWPAKNLAPWALAAAAPMLASGFGQSIYHVAIPRCSSHLRPIVDYVRAHRRDDEPIDLIGGNTWPSFYVYWRNPPGQLAAYADNDPVPAQTGRFWCVSEFAPGEFKKKRQPPIQRAAAGARLLDSSVGKGGAAFLYERPGDGNDKIP